MWRKLTDRQKRNLFLISLGINVLAWYEAVQGLGGIGIHTSVIPGWHVSSSLPFLSLVSPAILLLSAGLALYVLYRALRGPKYDRRR